MSTEGKTPPFPLGTYSPTLAIGVVPLAELEAGLELDPPVRALEDTLVVAPHVVDALADRPDDVIGYLRARPLDLVRA